MARATKETVLKELGNFIRVNNMVSDRGNDIPNQFELRFDGGIVFQSYNSVIAVKLYNDNKVYLGDDWDYSRTTGKYRNKFLGVNKAEIVKGLTNGNFQHVEGL